MERLDPFPARTFGMLLRQLNGRKSKRLLCPGYPVLTITQTADKLVLPDRTITQCYSLAYDYMRNAPLARQRTMWFLLADKDPYQKAIPGLYIYPFASKEVLTPTENSLQMTTDELIKIDPVKQYLITLRANEWLTALGIDWQLNTWELNS